VSRNGASHSPNPSSSASVRSAGITDVGVTLTPLAITAVSPRPSASTAVRMPQPPPPPERQEQHAVDENEETDEEVLNVLGDPSGFFFKDRDLVVPSKSQVLLYFATATNFKLRRTGGGELQVRAAATRRSITGQTLVLGHRRDGLSPVRCVDRDGLLSVHLGARGLWQNRLAYA
jgi:hypothetical protein